MSALNYCVVPLLKILIGSGINKTLPDTKIFQELPSGFY